MKQLRKIRDLKAVHEKKKWSINIVAVAILLLSFSTNVHATIINTSVSAGMMLNADVENVNIVSEEQHGTTSASVSINNSLGMTASSNLQLVNTSNETATLNFAISLDGNNIYLGENANMFMGESSLYSNNTAILYHALTDSILRYSWNFAYSDPGNHGYGPFGLNIIRIANGSDLPYAAPVSADLGNSGSVGTHSGSSTYNLTAGQDYYLDIIFHPYVIGSGIGFCGGELNGNISLDFGGQPVPEPATILLCVLGLAGFAVARKIRR